MLAEVMSGGYFGQTMAVSKNWKFIVYQSGQILKTAKIYNKINI